MPSASFPSVSQSPAETFRNVFDSTAQYLVTAPGRVNLIGEHTDYNLLPVLPMPIDRAITIHMAPRADSTVRFANTDSRYPAFEISLTEPIKPGPGHWGNYCLAALDYVTRHLTSAGTPAIRGFDALVHSTLPPASGLSSSSALVIATCLAMLQANDIQWSPTDIAEHMRLAEYFVGTAGGGMDQAAIALGQPDSALLIEFDPLKFYPVPVPDNITVFIINSGQEAEKSGAARYNYNRRALECALGAELLARKPGITSTAPAEIVGGPQASQSAHPTNTPTLRDIYNATISRHPIHTHHPCEQSNSSDLSNPSGPSDKSVTPFSPSHGETASSAYTAVSAAALSLPLDPLTPAQIQSLITPERFAAICKSKKLDPDATTEWLPDGLLQIFPRVSHVLNEANRVYALRDAFARNDRDAAFHISNAGHASCRDLYHISTPAIEQLVHLTRAAGAGSARITGAGFGGCIVALVPTESKETFLQNLQTAGIPPENIIKAKSQGPARVQQL